MNPRSIRFRLAAYQVLLLAGVLLAFSLAAFLGFRRHLTHLVEAQCANLTRQIADSLLANVTRFWSRLSARRGSRTL